MFVQLKYDILPNITLLRWKQQQLQNQQLLPRYKRAENKRQKSIKVPLEVGVLLWWLAKWKRKVLPSCADHHSTFPPTPTQQRSILEVRCTNEREYEWSAILRSRMKALDCRSYITLYDNFDWRSEFRGTLCADQAMRNWKPRNLNQENFLRIPERKITRTFGIK